MPSNLSSPTGFLGVGEDPRDWVLGYEASLDDLEDLEPLDDKVIEYNQKSYEDGDMACTMVGPLGLLSSMFNLKPSKAKVDEMIASAIDKGYDPDVGRYTQSGVKHVCKWRTQEYGDELTYHRTSLLRGDKLSPHVKNALDKNYGVVVSMKGNAQMSADYNDDGVLGGTEYGKADRGHVLWLYTNIGDDPEAVNSYKGFARYNRWTIAEFDKLIQNGYFYPACYIIMPKDQYNDELEKALDRAQDEGVTVAETREEYREYDNITRGDVLLMLYRLHGES